MSEVAEKTEIDAPSQVHIHIDREAYESPNPTTGEALYELGGIGKQKELFREARGDREDEFVPRDDSKVRLRDGDHFYSQKTFTVILNGAQEFITKRRLTFEEIVKMAFPNPSPDPNIIYTVAYRNGPPENPKGILLPGQTLRLKDGIEIDVTQTVRS